MSASPARLSFPLSGDLARRLSGRPRVVFLDIDGTLAPIAPRPDLVEVPADTMDALTRLAAVEHTFVAIVSGRGVEDARRLVPIAGAWTIGNHGIEVMDAFGRVRVDPRVAEHQPRVAEANQRVGDDLRSVPGVVIENKRWTLSIHYRLAARGDVPRITETVTRAARDLGLVVTRGKEVLEIRPPVPIHKGSAAAQLADALGATGSGASLVYAGDDWTDEDAFRALRAVSPRAVTVRVWDGGRDGDPGVGVDSAAEFVVPGPRDVQALIESLLLVSA